MSKTKETGQAVAQIGRSIMGCGCGLFLLVIIAFVAYILIAAA